MQFLKKPTFYLRAGLGAMYLYSGIDIVLHPTAWHWALSPVVAKLPQVAADFITNTLTFNTFLQIQGGIEILFALVFLAWFLPKKLAAIVTVISVLQMALILILVGIDYGTFRDIGVLGATLALFVILIRR